MSYHECLLTANERNIIITGSDSNHLDQIHVLNIENIDHCQLRKCSLTVPSSIIRGLRTVKLGGDHIRDYMLVNGWIDMHSSLDIVPDIIALILQFYCSEIIHFLFTSENS